MSMLPRHIDFLIVGAGPAGTATALSLLEQGVPAAHILLLDRVAFPRQKLCGGGLTGRAWERLDRWGIALEHVWNARGIHLVVEGKGQILAEPARLGTIDRWELDHKMLQRALALGVGFVVATVDGLQTTAGGWQVTTSAGDVECAYLVGADGYGSSVRRALECRRRRGGKLLEVTLETTAPIEPVLEMEFGPALRGIAGYLWTFPFYSADDGKMRVKYGIMDRSGLASTPRLRALLQHYVATKEGRVIALPAVVPGYPERYWHPFERCAGTRALLVGDAWGIDPLLGEGIAVAFEQAEYAARHLVRAWRRNGRISRSYAMVYPLTATGWNLWFLKKLGDFIYHGRSRFWLGILTVDKGLSRLSRTTRFGGYGRFARHPLWLSWIVIRHLLTPRRSPREEQGLVADAVDEQAG